MSEARLDGRTLRRERNQDAVVDAILALLRDGNLKPSAREIADRAGVSLRSLFRHFEDLDALFAAAVRRQLEQVEPAFELDVAPGPVDRRIRALVRHRASLYEQIAPVRRAATLQVPFHDPVRQGLEWSHRTLRHQLVTAFDPELAARSAKDRRMLLEALDVATGWSTWETLRTAQALNVAEAEAVVTTTLTALLS